MSYKRQFDECTLGRLESLCDDSDSPKRLQHVSEQIESLTMRGKEFNCGVLQEHLEACRQQLEKIVTYQAIARKGRIGEVSGELEAAVAMAEYSLAQKKPPTLRMVSGYQSQGSTGIDQIWADENVLDCEKKGGESRIACPSPIIVVEAKGGDSVLAEKECKSHRRDGGKNASKQEQENGQSFQMNKTWVAHHARKIAKLQQPGGVGDCILQGLEYGCPKVRGIVISNGKPYTREQYESVENKGSQIPCPKRFRPDEIVDAAPGPCMIEWSGSKGIE